MWCFSLCWFKLRQYFVSNLITRLDCFSYSYSLLQFCFACCHVYLLVVFYVLFLFIGCLLDTFRAFCYIFIYFGFSSFLHISDLLGCSILLVVRLLILGWFTLPLCLSFTSFCSCGGFHLVGCLVFYTFAFLPWLVFELFFACCMLYLACWMLSCSKSASMYSLVYSMSPLCSLSSAFMGSHLVTWVFGVCCGCLRFVFCGSFRNFVYYLACQFVGGASVLFLVVLLLGDCIPADRYSWLR